MDRPILTDLDLETFKLFRPKMGTFETLALTAQYDFTYEEYRQGAELFSSGYAADVPEVMKTMFHETAHLYQALTTPYGHYVHLLRSLQNNLVVTMIKLLQGKYGIRIKYPLIGLIETLKPAARYEELWFSATLWYQVELLLLYFEGDRYIYSRQRQNNPLLGRLSILDHFKEVEFYLSQYLAQIGSSINYPGAKFSSAEEQARFDLANFVLKMTGDIDVMSVMESWAKISEYWEAPEVAFTDGPHIFSGPMSGSQAKYYFCLQMAEQRLKFANIKEFVLTYSALCELAMFCPILPYHYPYRGEKITLNDIEPFYRLFSGMNAAIKVKPIRDLAADYPRFIAEVCAIQGWPTPMQISQADQGDGAPAKDLLSGLYNRAQRIRCQMPHAFMDMSVWYTPKNQITDELTYYFVHPVISLKDKILYHHDRSFIYQYVGSSLANNYLRKVLLSDDLSLEIPFRINQDGIEFFKSFLTEVIEATTGLQKPKIIIHPKAD